MPIETPVHLETGFYLRDVYDGSMKEQLVLLYLKYTVHWCSLDFLSMPTVCRALNCAIFNVH